MPPDEWTTLRWTTLRELLASPHQYVRYVTLRVAGRHRATALVPEIVADADQMVGQGDVTDWLRAAQALPALGADEDLDALEAAGDRDRNIDRRR